MTTVHIKCIAYSNASSAHIDYDSTNAAFHHSYHIAQFPLKRNQCNQREEFHSYLRGAHYIQYNLLYVIMKQSNHRAHICLRSVNAAQICPAMTDSQNAGYRFWMYTMCVQQCPLKWLELPPDWNGFCSHLDWPSQPYWVAVHFEWGWSLLLSVTTGEFKRDFSPTSLLAKDLS